MPKMKTHRGARKRLLVTKGGVRHKQAGRSHLLECKSAKRKRHLRHTGVLAPGDRNRVKRLLPYA